jgi:hypothetical protein
MMRRGWGVVLEMAGLGCREVRIKVRDGGVSETLMKDKG